MLKKSLLIIFIILVLDQILKCWIKTHMYLGQEFNVFGNWFIIHFTENNGIAFGLELPFEKGKLLLTLFRIFAVMAIGWYLLAIIKRKENTLFIVSLSFIFAGALGNIIDSVFYGLLFNDSAYQIATLLPDGGGYGSLLHGKVVDMLYFPILHGYFPSWIPFWGSEEFLFFRPVFNIADSAITVGVILLLIHQLKNKK